MSAQLARVLKSLTHSTRTLSLRSRPYSFGLGKRSADEDAPSDDELVNNIDQEDLTDLINEYEDPGTLADVN